MFLPSAHMHYGPSGQPVNREHEGLCHCDCHGHAPRPPAVEARLCRECADERFIPWNALVDVLMRDD